MKLLVKSGGREAMAEWQRHFGAVDPTIEVVYWEDAGDPASVDYVMAWEPPAGWLATLPNLKVVFSSGAGVDHITKDPAWPSQLPLVRMGGPDMAQRMGEFVVWSALSLLRDTRDFALGQPLKEWRYKEVPHSAADRRVGVMGLGNLGLRSAQMLSAVGFPVQGWSRSAKSLPGMKTFAGAAEFDAFIESTDILVCLLPVTPDTADLIDAKLLANLPAGAQIINVGRGQHVVDADLIAALDSGHIAGAVLDVFRGEPLAAESPLWTHERVTVTPHIASTPTRAEKAEFVARCIGLNEKGEAMPNIFDPARGY
ncbi:2-hydroxyacid dehydrogenase [Devosia sediminis]|uniref:Glyoxylate/hydroxypyruvate reductase A n=1 Tax=Devosia sediminis TaxID=2798801 RepID=A0A934J053_9HYPH|nr:glyoxylate/hydroxypyruvate reductase A [Devosia sediminis]MBJ3785375.1 glyoxylate/hydroxypyruvate reductase A [Devosia sediminis]